jgi:hypothetical protein
MSKRTRVKRPTTATPRKVGTLRYLHVSAEIRDEYDDAGRATGKRLIGAGKTYRKVQS